MKQELNDIPKTEKEYRRQKGPIPPVAIFLALALIAAFVLYYLPVFAKLIPGGE